MKINSLIGIAAVVLAVTACNGCSRSDNRLDKVDGRTMVLNATFTPASRTTIVDNDADGVDVQWDGDDRVGVFSSNAAASGQSLFTNQLTEPSDQARFYGSLVWEQGDLISAYAPYDKQNTDPRAVCFDLTGQVQQSTTSTHIAPLDLLVAEPQTATWAETIDFGFSHRFALLRFDVSLPLESAANSIKAVSMRVESVTDPIFTVAGTVDITDAAAPITSSVTRSQLTLNVDDGTLNKSKTMRLYMVAAPIDLSGQRVVISIVTDAGNYTVVKSGREIRAGRRIRIDCNATERELQQFSVVRSEAHTPVAAQFFPQRNYIAFEGRTASLVLSVSSTVALPQFEQSYSGGAADGWLGLTELSSTDSNGLIERLFRVDFRSSSARTVTRAAVAFTDGIANKSIDVDYFGTLALGSVGSVKSLSLSPEREYSGITWLGDDSYAVVSDKQEGFYLFDIPVNTSTGAIGTVACSDLYGNGEASKDYEGVVWVPSRGTLFISGEGNKQIVEYNLDGTKTGAQLAVPAALQAQSSNYGFEALGYNALTGLFWTTTESTLPADGTPASPSNRVNNPMRIQSFGSDLSAAAQYGYLMDIPSSTNTGYSNYAFGIPSITALDDGRLLIMEREFWVGSGLIGKASSFVTNKIYVVNPQLTEPIDFTANLSSLAADRFMTKTLLTSFTTRMSSFTIANYEGMCLGPTIGSARSLLLVNDSQSGYSGVLSEYIKLLTFTVD